VDLIHLRVEVIFVAGDLLLRFAAPWRIRGEYNRGRIPLIRPTERHEWNAGAMKLYELALIGAPTSVQSAALCAFEQWESRS
jgi:hypothetical protein